ncbi:MAG: fibronectin type III domain-containing protein, partial [Angustibacter sp.]
MPEAVVIERVQPDNLGMVVAWLPSPAAEEVTEYRVRVAPSAEGPTPPASCQPVTGTSAATDSARIVTGLCVGVAYVATVTAVNTAGAGPASALSDPAVPLPVDVADQPQITNVLARNNSAIASWTPSLATGGSPLTGFVVTAKQGSTTTTVRPTATESTATLAGLVNGTEATITVAAVNAQGSSPVATITVTPSAARAPAEPGQLSALPDGRGGAGITWVAPDDNGGSAITGYRVTTQQVQKVTGGIGYAPVPGAAPVSRPVASGSTSLAIPSFSPANALYQVSVVALNAVGTGKPVSTTNPLAPVTVVDSRTIVLSPATMAALAPVTGTDLVWPAPAPAQLATVKVGSVLVAAAAPSAPSGLLRVVEAISQPQPGSYVLSTRAGQLSDVFSQLAFSRNSDALGSSTAAAQFRPATAGIQARALSADLSLSSSLYLSTSEKGWSTSSSTGASVEFSVSHTASVQADLDLGVQVSTRAGIIPEGASVSVEGKVSAKSTLSAQFSGEFDRKIGELADRPMYFQVGPVPVVITAKVAFYLNIKGEISAQIESSMGVGARAQWNSDLPGELKTENISGPNSARARVSPGLSARATVDFGVRAEILLALYDVAGPTVKPYLGLRAELIPTAGPSENYFTLSAVAAIGVGFKFEVLGFKAEIDRDLADTVVTLWTIKNPPVRVLEVTPKSATVAAGSSTTFKAAWSDKRPVSVTWKLIGGLSGESISPAGVLTTLAPGGRSLRVQATAPDGSFVFAPVFVGLPFAPPGSLSLKQPADSPNIQVSWAAPRSSGDSPLAYYLLDTTPATTRVKIPAGSTSYTVTGAQPGRYYVVRLLAVNGLGKVSPAATA